MKRRLEQVRGVHGPAGCSAGADNRMNFVDKQNRTFDFLHPRHNGLEAFLKVTTISGSGQQCPHIKGVYDGVFQNFWHFFIDDTPGDTLGNGGFANARVPDEQRIIFTAAGEHHNAALNLFVAAD